MEARYHSDYDLHKTVDVILHIERNNLALARRHQNTWSLKCFCSFGSGYVTFSRLFMVKFHWRSPC
jgi:hypothetical protein